MNTVFKCVLCSAEAASFVNKVRDDEKRSVMQCNTCGHIQITPLPTLEEDNEYYQTNAMHRVQIPKSIMTDQELMNKLKPYGTSEAEWASEFLTPQQHILEIGSGYGWYVQNMKERGFEHIDGAEISDEKRIMVKERSGIELYAFNLLTEDYPNSMKGKYDALCIFHVLEHIADPIMFLQKASVCLKQGGKLLIAVPNVDDFMKHECIEYNDVMYLRAHISYFSAKTLKNTIQKAGFKNISIIGKQFYSIENALHWLRNRKPFLQSIQTNLPSCLEYVNKFYKSETEKNLTSDTLFATAEL